MQKINTAVILAAGMGTRLKGFIDDRPKGLMKVGDREIIKESLDRLKKGGINNIILVTGYQHETYVEALKDEYPTIQYVQNPDFETTGSMHSLFVTRGTVTTDFLLLESDLLYEDRCITEILKTEPENVILLSGETKSCDEVYVYGQDDTIQRISKEKTDKYVCQGELVGISKISFQLFEHMCDYYADAMDRFSNYHYENCISDLSGQTDIQYHKVEDIVWTEIDNIDHYNRAVELIYPKIYGVKCN